jgi:hypothetical protein
MAYNQLSGLKGGQVGPPLPRSAMATPAPSDNDADDKPHTCPMCKGGGKLTDAERRKFPANVFGLPDQRKYPMPDASHAANAKARATQQVNAGNLSSSDKARVDAKANHILGK